MEKNMHYICVKDVEGTPLGEMVNIISFSWSMPQSSCHTCRWQEWKMTDRFRDTKVVPLILELNRLVESYHLDHHPIKKSPLRRCVWNARHQKTCLCAFWNAPVHFETHATKKLASVEEIHTMEPKPAGLATSTRISVRCRSHSFNAGRSASHYKHSNKKVG